MSTLTVTNIKATGETASRAVSGVAAVYFCYDHASNTVDESLGVSSISDVATGRFTTTFTNSMAAATYGVATAAFVDYTAIRGSCILGVHTSSLGAPDANLSKTTSDIDFSSMFSASSSANAGVVDLDAASAEIHGDLA